MQIRRSRPAGPSLASRGVRRLRRKLGLPPSIRMTPEAAKFIADYREWLGQCIGRADEYLAAHEGASVVDTLKDSKGLMDELAELQAESGVGRAAPYLFAGGMSGLAELEAGRADLDLYLPVHTMVYLICRKLRPDKAVETGVQKGGTSHMILSALHRNASGHLWSIDIAPTLWYKGVIVSNIGPLVENHMKSRWNLIKGDAQEVLEDVLGKTGDIDMFCAGQGHTYEVQKHEGRHAWPRLRSGGVFVLDRADWNDNRYLGEFMAEHSDGVAWHGTFKEGSSEDPFEFTVIVKK